MSKAITTKVYIKEDVRSIASARSVAQRAMEIVEHHKSELFSLITATPKDITPEGECPFDYLKMRYEEIWEGVWDGIIDEYVHTLVADDAEYHEDSTVAKEWKAECDDLERIRKQCNDRVHWMKTHNLNEFNFDHLQIYEYCKDNGMMDVAPFTETAIKELIETIKKEEEEILKNAVESLKSR